MQDVIIGGITYESVPAFKFIKSGGGDALFYDVSDTTAAASDVKSGKYFYAADGTKTLGTSAMQSKSVTPPQSANLLVEPDAGYAGLSSITVLPSSWYGTVPQYVGTYLSKDIKLSDTNWSNITPSNTAQEILASSTYTQQLSAIDIVNYDYVVRWTFRSTLSYDGSQTSSLLCYGVAANIYYVSGRRPNNYAQIISDTFNYNYCATDLAVNGIIDYLSSSGNRSITYTSAYGVCPAFVAQSLSSTSSQTPNMTLKSPTINARCGTNYWSTSNATHVDPAKSSIHFQCDVYRVNKLTASYIGGMQELIKLYKGTLS